MFKLIFVFIFAVLYFSRLECREFPNSLKNLRCSMSDDINSCVVKNGNLAIPIVAEGLPEFKIQTFNPLEISFVQLISSPAMSLNLTDVKIHGLNKLRLIDARIDLQQGIIEGTVTGANVTMEGTYIVNGQVLQLPIRGSGAFSLYLKDGIYRSVLKCVVIEKNGIKYPKSVGNNLTYNFKLIKFKLDNLFEGNKQLGDEMNKFLNDNWEMLLADFGPGIAQTISDFHRKHFDELTEDLPLNELFLD